MESRAGILVDRYRCVFDLSQMVVGAVSAQRNEVTRCGVPRAVVIPAKAGIQYAMAARLTVGTVEYQIPAFEAVE